MSWATVSNIAPPKASAVPTAGVSVSARKLGTRSGKSVSYIRIVIGSDLAKKLCLVLPETGMALKIGSGQHSGLVALTVDNSKGNFQAKKDKAGNYVLTINEGSAAGMFSLSFPTFTADAAILPPERNIPPVATFKATAEMLGQVDRS